jgi:hypothetical protein
MTSPTPHADPTPPLAERVIELFDGELSHVAFPGVDARTLAAHRDEVLDAQLALEAAEDALEAARRQLEARVEALSSHARRALAYARVFAGDDATLLAAVDAIASPRADQRLPAARAADASAPRKRGRPRKEAGAPLFHEPDHDAGHERMQEAPPEGEAIEVDLAEGEGEPPRIRDVGLVAAGPKRLATRAA